MTCPAGGGDQRPLRRSTLEQPAKARSSFGAAIGDRRALAGPQPSRPQDGEGAIGVGVHVRFAGDDLPHPAVGVDDDGDPSVDQRPRAFDPRTSRRWCGWRPTATGTRDHAVPRTEPGVPRSQADAHLAGTQGRELGGEVPEGGSSRPYSPESWPWVEEQHHRPGGQEVREPDRLAVRGDRLESGAVSPRRTTELNDGRALQCSRRSPSRGSVAARAVSSVATTAWLLPAHGQPPRPTDLATCPGHGAGVGQLEARHPPQPLLDGNA